MSLTKKTVLRHLILIFLILAHPSIQSEELLKGLKYSKLTTPLMQNVHLLDVDPEHLDIIAAHAKETVLGLETVTAIAKRYNAIAAINGGFFKIGESIDGLPAGILKIRGLWFGIAYSARGAVGWSDPHHPVLMDRIQTQTKLYLNHQKFPVHLLNQPVLSQKAILYTDAYGKQIDTGPDREDIIIHHNRVIGIKASGITDIPANGYVYSRRQKITNGLHPIKIGDPATIHIEVIPQLKEHSIAWQTVDNIIGGTPLLLSRGRVTQDLIENRSQSPFIVNRHARSAVGILKNGHWLFVAVEQNPFTGSPGMTIPELATFMEKMNCEQALNLDGGGSSTLYINNEVVNHPMGDADQDLGLATVRPVSDAILILPKK